MKALERDAVAYRPAYPAWGAAAVAWALTLATGACVTPERSPRASDGGGTAVDTGPSQTSGAVELVDEAAVLERAFAYATELTKVNIEVELGTHGDADTVNFYAATENLQLFKTIDPDLTDQRVNFIDGTMFVKEHLDPSAQVIGFTVMFKGPPGYNPEAADWFWARVSEGTITHQGSVGFCQECHVGVDNTDYVFGLRLDNQQ